MPLEIIQAVEHEQERSLGWLALDWLQHFAVHGPGDVEGRSLRRDGDPDALPLDREFSELIVDHYALDANGRRLYDSAFTSRAKGRAKSELAAFEVLFEAFGPCRFAGWAVGGEVFRWRDFVYEYLPGEPMGRPVVYPFIRCLATEEGQAGNTYDNVHYNLTQGPLSEGLPRDAAGLTRTLLPHGGEIVPSTASNAAKDGGKETHVVFDETHLYVTPELGRMYRTVRRNMAKRKDAQPWSHETSTMYLPGEGSVAEETHKQAKRIMEGRVKRQRLYFNHREGTHDVDLGDEVALVAALREAYGPFADVMDLQRIVDEIWDPRNPPSESRRYFLNQPTSAADAWLQAWEWAARRVEEDFEPGDTITLGFDGSRKRSRGVTDATALVACRVSDGLVRPVRVWEQPDGPAGEGWQVPTHEVDATVAEVFDTYRVVGFYADPAKWEGFIASWEAKYGSKLLVKATRQNPVEWWMTGGRSLQIVRALEQFKNAVLDGELKQSGHGVLSRHVLNARLRSSSQGWQIAKAHPDSAEKIDAAVAAVLAWQARLDAVAAGVGVVRKARAARRLY